MNYWNIIKRAFNITISQRALWLFGILLALSSGAGGGGGGRFGSGANFKGENTTSGDLSGILPGRFPHIDTNWLIAMGIGVLCLMLLLAVLFVIMRYVARTALIGMVQQVEAGESVVIRDGWRWGWSKLAFRLFLIDLIVGIPLAIFVLIMFAIAFSPLLFLLLQRTIFTVMAIIGTVGLFILVIMILIAISIVVSLLLELAWRFAVLQNKGITDSLKAGFEFARANLKDIAIIWLLMLAIGFAWVIVSIILFLLCLIFAGLVGGTPAMIAYFITRSATVALITGVPLALIAFVLPLLFVNGLYRVFQSSVWTLTYRHLQEQPGEASAPAN